MRGVHKMAMTRKHYIQIADAIKDNECCSDCIKKTQFIDELLYIFKSDNNNFDNQRFINYVNERGE